MPLHPQEHPTLVRVANFHRREVPAPPPADGPPRAPRRLEVFAVGTDWVQLTWSRLGPGAVMFRCGDHRGEVIADGGPGSFVLRNLPSSTELDVEVTGEGLATSRRTLRTRTLDVPPGEELLRLATVSDVHIGTHTTGFFHTIAELPAPDVPHPVRCLRAAQTEAAYWGANRLIVKGDLVDRSEPENWRDAADVLGALSVPVHVIPGNHERSKPSDLDAHDGAAQVGLDLVEGVRVVDADGLRIVMADTTLPHTDLGRITDVADDVIGAAGTTSSPVFVALHHQLMRFTVPTYIPVGIPRPSARRFLSGLGQANPRTIVSSGHTHRHRRYRHGPVTVTEVGSTKDFPGTWASYQFHEGGVVQSVRRIGAPSVIRWTDHTRRAALGVWALWAPGSLDERCFTVRWSS